MSSQWISNAAAIATVTASVAVVITALIYHGQLRAMTKARQLESLLAIMKYADDAELRQARHFMLEHGQKLKDLFEVPFSWEARRAINAKIQEISSGTLTVSDTDAAINALNNICFLIRYGYAPMHSADEFLKNSLLHGWNAFEPYVKHRRNRTDTVGEPSRYGVHLEWIVVNHYGRSNETV